MSVTTLAHPGPDHPHGPRSRALRTCPTAVPPAPALPPTVDPAPAPDPALTREPDVAEETSPIPRLPGFGWAVGLVAAFLRRGTEWTRDRGRAAAQAVLREDRGMSTVEYAIGTVAAAAFGVVLYTVVTGDSIVTALTGLVQRALQIEF